MSSPRSHFFQQIEPKEFERLCSDLLEAEGFRIESEPSVDRTGVDLVASEEYRSHATGDVIHVRWKVQCKRYVSQNLGRGEMERILWAFDAGRHEGDALLVIVSSDYSEDAGRVVAEYMATRAGTKVSLWNQRQLYARIEKHPEVLRRYGGEVPAGRFEDVFVELKSATPRRVLIVSDQSALAHDFIAGFRRAGWEIALLSIWNYMEPSRERLFLTDIRRERCDLVVLFLGDSFGFPLSQAAQQLVVEMAEDGTAVMLFPFLAWSVSRRLLTWLSELCPVRLLDPLEAESTFALEAPHRPERLGDFGYLLGFDSFAEGRYSEFDPRECQPAFAEGIEEPFGLLHTFEFILERPEASVVWRDRRGIPFVVSRESRRGGRVCYVNTCCHSCMSLTPLTSPLEASVGFAYLARNCIRWLVRDTVVEVPPEQVR